MNAIINHYVLFLVSFCALGLCSCSNNNGPADSTGVSASIVCDTILNPVQALGKKLFFDINLSNPPGQSCASCHSSSKAFVDPANTAVSAGAIKTLFGSRNAPTVAYAAFTPHFHYDSTERVFVGGLFWDGRAATLSEQAMQPLLNHVEMNNTADAVVERIKKSDYKDLFLSIFGSNSLSDVNKAFEYAADAIEEYEETKEVSPFTSKFDYYLKGKADLTEQEKRRLQLFEDTAKGNCAACHPTKPAKYTNAILFTDFTYDNIGLPPNPEIKKLNNDLPIDLGLGAIVKQKSENGKFKVPTLRNIAVTAPYFHNGVIKTLEESVKFYNERDSGKFGPPEVAENINEDELGNLKLTEQEIKDIVAFMETLTDGYKP